jgi:hypothetical protein
VLLLSRKRKITVRGTLMVLCVSLVSVLTTAYAPAKNHKVYFPSNCTNTRYKPTHLIAACGDAGLQVHKIKWSHYGAKSATGSGTSAINTCTPDCASGNIKRNPAVVRLSRAKDCAGVSRTVFTRLKVTSAGNTITFPFPCSIYD